MEEEMRKLPKQNPESAVSNTVAILRWSTITEFCISEITELSKISVGEDTCCKAQ